MLSMGLRLWQHPAADPFRASSADYRSTVLLRGMEGVSIETLQALAIVAFDIIGSGHGPSAWSVIGSMSRTVEQIRLNAEEESTDAGPSQLRANEVLLRRIRFLRPSQNWVEEEERRRLFWSIFMMDRFCSVTTGWSNSLGIQNYSSPRPSSLQQEQAQYPTDEAFPDRDSTADGIGGFAYCIEATESLNLVTNFLLQHSLAFREAKEAQRWLMRFRDLDLRLIKWRFFLPDKWRDASAPNHDGILDPNLVLAHLTHNTAVIQLHQAVAFRPSKVQPFSVELPQASSLQTCLAAANEIGTIALHFLDQEAGIVSPQVAVCLFIAARSLLTHSKVCQLPVSSSFDTLSAALQRVSERWSSSQTAVAQDGEVRPLLPLASRLSERLAMAKKSLHTVGEVPLAMSIEQPVYSGHAARSRANSIGPELEHDIPGQPPRRQHKSSTQRGVTSATEGAGDQAELRPSRSIGSSGHFGLVDASNGSTSAAQMVDPDLTLFTLLPDFFEPTPAASLSRTGFSEAFPTADLSLDTTWPLASNENRSTPQPGAPPLNSQRRTATVESNSDGISEIDEMLDMLMQNQNGAMGRVRRQFPPSSLRLDACRNVASADLRASYVPYLTIPVPMPGLPR
ncbi:hypothetical protein L1887_54881 [Cichorium endivia]|nr:hypothetical protein L1887_54881 [Cichorium endivia]